MPTTALRPMRADDAEAVLAIQQQAYPSSHHESWAVLGRKLQLWPAGCWVAPGSAGALLGYVFSHPWQRGRTLPLHGVLEALPAPADCFHLHDLALHAAARGQGLARRLVTQVLDAARAAGQRQLTLVAVQGSQGFWQRLDFAVSGLAASASYGAEALAMARTVSD